MELSALDIRLNELAPAARLPCITTPVAYVAWVNLRVLLIVVLGVLHDAQTNLLEVGLARGTTSIFSCPGKYWEQNCREDCYDSNDDEEFYECEPLPGYDSMLVHTKLLKCPLGTNCVVLHLYGSA
jgi:hypothetical protein